LPRSRAVVTMSVSVCIATYRRVEQLDALLGDLRRQTLLPDQVVVADNDEQASARAIVERQRSSGAPFRLEYAIQPQRNIARTRNLTVALADGEWLAFIDDDERAPEDWLRLLVAAADRYEADGVLSPVEPRVPPDAPDWIRRGRFYDFPHQPSGAPVPLNCMRFGNVLLRGYWLRAEPGPFDVRYGLATGEDGDLLVRLARRGARIVWSEDAPVFEPVEPRRLSLRWLLRRAFSGGQEFALQTVRGKYASITWVGRGVFFVRAALQLLIAAVLAVICWPAGRHWAVGWLIKVWANFGKLTAFWGWRLQAYS
jgi:succinoglycan biosynthesis protein ExoM